MKVKIELEIDTERQQDLETVEEMIAILRELVESFEKRKV